MPAFLVSLIFFSQEGDAALSRQQRGATTGAAGPARVKGRPHVQVHLKDKRRPPVLLPAKGIEVAKNMGVTDLALAELMQYKARP